MKNKESVELILQEMTVAKRPGYAMGQIFANNGITEEQAAEMRKKIPAAFDEIEL